jgi:hypothetical protein
LQQARANGDDKVRTMADQVYPAAVKIFNTPKPSATFRPAARKICPMKTVCTINHYTRAQSCTAAKDYWSDCDG